MVGSEMVDLYVGPKKKHFRVHKALLCHKIPYFAGMFKSGFKEATENSANFPEDTPSTFDILSEWLYTGSLRQLYQSRNHTAAGPTFVSDWAPQQVYALADKLCLSD